MTQGEPTHPAAALLLRSTRIEPVAVPGIDDGAVLANGEGRVLAVGRFADLRREVPADRVRDLGRGLLVPGFVNAHCHLELSDQTPGDPPASFADWLLAVRAKNQHVEPAETRVHAAVARGVRASLAAGVTCVGDVTAHPALTRAALAGSPLRVVSFGEALGLGRLRAKFDERLAAAIEPCAAANVTVGLAPHAPYTVDVDGYRTCVRVATERRLPLTTHLAESPDEERFLRAHDGPLRALWDAVDLWPGDGEPAVPTFAGSPVALAAAVGLLDLPAVLAHVNHVSDPDVALLARGRAGVAYCPRTHAYFGHPTPHPWRRLKAAGVRVALGTDSAASSPSLDLVDDARLVWARGEARDPDELLRMLTLDGAAALGVGHERGVLAPGRSADAAFYADATTFADVLDDAGRVPTHVFVVGEEV